MTDRLRGRRHVLKLTGAAIGGVAMGSAAATTNRGEPGTERWHHSVTGPITSSPTVVDGTVYVGSDDFMLYAFDATDGDREWFFTPAHGQAKSSPQVIDGTVYAGFRIGRIYAIDSSTGDDEWFFEPDRYELSSPTVAKNAVFFGTGAVVPDGGEYVGRDLGIYAVDRTSGERLWRFETDGAVDSSPAVVDGVVYVGCDDNTVYAIDAHEGTDRWQFQTGDSVTGSPTVVDGTVYVGSHDSRLYAIDSTSGTDTWEYETDGPIRSTPTVADDVAYVGSDDGSLYAIDTANGSREWRFQTGDAVESSPTVVGQTVFVGSNDGSLYAVDTRDGSEVWRFETTRSITSSPTVVDGIVYVGSQDSTVYAVHAGVPGSSGDSRITQGVLGHTNRWSTNSVHDEYVPIETRSDSTDGSDDGMPGFGPAAAVTGIAGAGYALKRRLDSRNVSRD
ncbi:PQQ-binding-like beta-propeller repeat protein [Halovivax gelatinilyticus]|uniref:outer membrane protein assembly factor BamB family protein n=1 Tax=Halovivax gelatinilyticus TaxID=2961597 RepID=UPI0020CA40E0|nr:PQQ-binding-like beta-propeller repeat protein [Halovivax gelatinilyticus]